MTSREMIERSAPESSSTAVLEVDLLGRFRASWGGRTVRELHHAKAQELLAYLLINRERSHAREALASVLWEGEDACSPRKSLRQTLWQLQSALATAAPHLEKLVEQLGPDWIRLHRDVEVRVDVDDLKRALERAEACPRPTLTEPILEETTRAIGFYRGSFLEGIHSPWCDLERERLREVYLRLGERLIDFCLLGGKYASGIEYGMRLLRVDPVREKTHRRMMRLYYFQGDRIQALRQYEHCVEALRRDLDVAPSHTTRRLNEQIRTDQLAALAEPAALRRLRGEGDGRKTLDLLLALRGLLSEARRQVHSEILAFENEPPSPD